MAEKTIRLELIRAFWTGDDKRVNEGEIVEVSPEDALRLIEEGIAKRVEQKPAKAGHA